MVCRLCLQNTDEYFEFFNDNGLLLNLAFIVSKYFWFEPQKNDPISNTICSNCWENVESFHIFYTSIEEAQKKITEHLEPYVDCKTTTNHHPETDLIKVEENSSDLFIPEASTGSCENSSSSVDEIKSNLKLNSKNKNDETVFKKEQSASADTDPLEKVEENTAAAAANDKSKNTKLRKTSSRKENIKKKKLRQVKCKLTKKLTPAVEAEYDEKIASFMKLTCSDCSQDFCTFRDLKSHIRIQHDRRGFIKCCNKKFFRRVYLLEHVNLHLNPDYFRCHQCNKSFSDRRSRENHNSTFHETKTFKCDLCPRKYAKKYLLTQHSQCHLKSTDWKCNICDKAFTTKSRMMNHLNYVHKNAYSKVCDICAKICRSKTSFDQHMQEHNGVVEPKVQCEKCQAWLKNAKSLKAHMKRHSEENDQHVCNLCGKIAPSDGALKSHYRYVHAEKTHKCSVCEKAFRKPLGLKEHMTTHTGEVLYTCTLCPTTFNSNANMWSHKKKVHRIEWEADRKNRKLPQDVDTVKLKEEHL